MARVSYDWAGGAKYDPHTERKHKVLREYLRQYLITRCQLPQLERFRFVIVDGFAGAGLYEAGQYGSPLIFLDTLRDTFLEINARRAVENMRQIEIECLLLLNDNDAEAYAALRQNTAGLIAQIKEETPRLHLKVAHYNRKFEELYPELKAEIGRGRYKNVLFNLDQYAYSDVSVGLLTDIMGTWASAEVFLTFAIETILAFLSPDQAANRALNREDEIRAEIYASLKDGKPTINKKEWLGYAEKTIFRHLKAVAPFVSPFSIHNPDGWRYWLLHFANRPRARQVYNDVLHDNATSQAHFGRSGLDMLAYDPDEEAKLYLFDDNSRERAVDQLHEDIPRLISDHGDALTIEDFNLQVYKETAAHSSDIQSVLIENSDLEVLTAKGGERRSANAIRAEDTLRLKTQRGFPLFVPPIRKR